MNVVRDFQREERRKGSLRLIFAAPVQPKPIQGSGRYMRSGSGGGWWWVGGRERRVLTFTTCANICRRICRRMPECCYAISPRTNSAKFRPRCGASVDVRRGRMTLDILQMTFGGLWVKCTLLGGFTLFRRAFTRDIFRIITVVVVVAIIITVVRFLFAAIGFWRICPREFRRRKSWHRPKWRLFGFRCAGLEFVLVQGSLNCLRNSDSVGNMPFYFRTSSSKKGTVSARYWILSVWNLENELVTKTVTDFELYDVLDNYLYGICVGLKSKDILYFYSQYHINNKIKL